MEMPRVGILSMQRIQNYGSFLQAYGLKSVLEELDCEVQFVDYEPGLCLGCEEAHRRSHLARKASKTFETLGYKAPLASRLAFIHHKRTYANRFYPMLGLTDRPNLHPELDLLVIGSDEVFNCVQSNANVGFTPTLFGQGIDAARKTTYAASFGNTTLAELESYGARDKVAKWLSELDSISVRDANSASIVKTLTDSNATCHLDPVLVYDFMHACDKVPDSVDESKYIVLYGYSARFTEEECAAVRSWAASRGLRVLNIGGIQNCCDRFVDCSPFEVLAYFTGAEAVVTDTFHGTILATITERPFATFVRNDGYGNSQKLNDLLEKLGLKTRIADAASLARTLNSPMEWQTARGTVEIGRQESRAYLGRQLACIPS